MYQRDLEHCSLWRFHLKSFRAQKFCFRYVVFFQMALDGKMTNTTDVDLKLLSLNIFILIYLWSQITLVNIKGLYHLVTGYSEASVVVRKQLVSPAVLSWITHKPKLYLHIFCTKITWLITCNLGVKKVTWLITCNLGLKKSTWFINYIK